MVSLKELRKYRFLSLSAIDLFGTIFIDIIILYILSKISSIKFNFKNLLTLIIASILLGILTHKALRVNTKLNYELGLSDKPELE